MNYIKIFDVNQLEAEEKINGWLKGIHHQGHRVMGSRYHFYEGELGGRFIKAVFTVNDEAKPSRINHVHTVKNV